MFCKNLLALATVLLLGSSAAQGLPFGSWSAQGVVVNKTFRSTPLTYSLGVDGIYRLELRDRQNKIRRQMVTRAVFLAYEIGDQFNERSPLRKKHDAPEEAERVAATAKDNSKLKSDGTPAAATGQKESKNRLASASFTPDMLPETEGF